MNWARGAAATFGGRRPEGSGGGAAAAAAASEHSIFVGDLAPEVNDFVLQYHFRQHYGSVRSAKVVSDATTGCSKGYGFVRFSSSWSATRR